MKRQGYGRDDVETHSEHYGKVRPAVNVKVHRFPSSDKIMERFGCEEKEAEKAGQFAFDSACTIFWEDVQDFADDVFGKGSVKVYSEGRSGGWLVVDGLSSIEDWTIQDLNKWKSFEARIKDNVKWRTSEESVFEDIEANQWTKKGSEAFNFVDKGNGEHVCLADLKREAIEKGYGPVVRK